MDYVADALSQPELPESESLERELDISARLERGERFRLMVNMAPCPLLLVRYKDFIVLDLNQKAAEVFGAPVRELVARSCVEFFALTQAWLKLSGEVMRTGAVYDQEMLFRRCNGESFWGLVSIVLTVPVDEAALMIGIVDITGRRQMEIMLRESEELYRSVIRASPDGIVISDLDGKIKYGSPAVLKQFGFNDADEIIGKPVTLFLKPEEKEKVKQSIQAVIRRGSRNASEYAAERKDGSAIYVEATAEVIHGMDDEPSGIVFILRDISRRKKLEQAEKKARQVAQALQQASLAVNSTLNFHEILDRILEQIVKVIACDMASILLQEGDEVVLAAIYGLAQPEQYLGQRFSLENESPNRLAAQERKPVVVENVQLKFPSFRKPATDEIKSWMGIPLMVKEAIIGFLNLDSKDQDHFTNEDQHIAEVFANQVSIALANARLYENAQRRIKELSALNEIIQSVTAVLNIDDLLELVYQQLKRFIPANFVLIGRYDPKSEEWYSLYCRKEEQKMQILRQPVEFGLGGYVIQSRHSLFLNDVQQVAQFMVKTGRQSLLSVPKAVIIVPLIVSDQVIGILGVQNDDKEHAFLAEDFELLNSIGAQVAVALENARLYSQMEQLAEEDSLTGIFNRRHFFILAEKEFERTKRYGKPLSAIMLDIDHFKRINDAFGHAVGDQMLKGVAQICSQSLRKIDILGRYGGEEFVMLLPETNGKGAMRAAERLRERIETFCIETSKGSLSVTASIGVGTLQGNEANLEILLNYADQSLYAAKSAGRNQAKWLVEYHNCAEEKVTPGDELAL
jgi:diguanylate cyclase (GGDEF)-like protein/PAS domain S-box-containing protein